VEADAPGTDEEREIFDTKFAAVLLDGQTPKRSFSLEMNYLTSTPRITRTFRMRVILHRWGTPTPDDMPAETKLDETEAVQKLFMGAEAIQKLFKGATFHNCTFHIMLR
jgi:hypothetical protein